MYTNQKSWVSCSNVLDTRYEPYPGTTELESILMYSTSVLSVIQSHCFVGHTQALPSEMWAVAHGKLSVIW